MQITVDSQSPIPLYWQIAEQIRAAIQAGEYLAGDVLPSVRKLSESLRVSTSSVVKAYELLKSSGWVAARKGKGLYVRGAPAASDSASAPDIDSHLRAAVVLGIQCGLGVEQLCSRLRELYRENLQLLAEDESQSPDI